MQLWTNLGLNCQVMRPQRGQGDHRCTTQVERDIGCKETKRRIGSLTVQLETH